MKVNIKKKALVLIALAILFLSDCATYNAKKDPVYQAYLRGEVTYSEYVDHYHKLMAEQYQQRQAIAAGFQDFSRSMKDASKQRTQERQADALEDIGRGVDDISWELRKANSGY